MKARILLPISGILLLAIISLAVLAVVDQLDTFRFSRIHGGATMNEVQRIVGLPDNVAINEAHGYIVWHYPDPWPWRSSTTVFFGTNGVYRVYHP